VSSNPVSHIHSYFDVTFPLTTQKCYRRVTHIYFNQVIDLMNILILLSDKRLPNDTRSTQRLGYG
jgi:hypothetical protein